MKPSEKDPALEAILDDMALKIWGRSRTESIKNNVCLVCGNPATTFSDERSEKEYTLSGMCQECQNEAFKETSEGED